MSSRPRPTRFGITIIDVFGSTEGAIALDRSGGPPRGSVGRLRRGILVVDSDGGEAPRARFDAEGRLVNAEECVGEIVNTLGVGPFEGYYRNEEAMRRTTRNGWYWSGDLGYVDEDGLGLLRRPHLRLAAGGRGELPGRPDRGHRRPSSRRHDGLGLRRARRRFRRSGHGGARAAEGRDFDGASFAAWLDGQPDLSPKWRPRFVRAAEALPTTPTNKVLTRTLVHEKFRSDLVGGDAVYVRERGADSFRRFATGDEAALRGAFESSGRRGAWDL